MESRALFWVGGVISFLNFFSSEAGLAFSIRSRYLTRMRHHSWVLCLLISSLFQIMPGAQAADVPSPKGASLATPRKIQIEEFDQLRSKTNYVVLDVRSPEEYKAGHVPNAVNLNVHDPLFAKQMSSLDATKTYLVHCARGRRSALATDQMNQKGLTNVLDFTGGFEVWQKSGKSVVK